MSLTLVTAPAVEPISLAEAKLHLRVDVDDENGLIQGLIVAARQYAETYTGRAFLQQTWDQTRDAFPCGVWLLPLPPVTSVTSITYLDTAGASQTWDSANYLTDFPSGPHAAKARITPAYGVSYPSTYGVMRAVTVRFVAGYGTTPASVPPTLALAVKTLITHWYERPTERAVPEVVDALLWPFKVF